MYLSERTGHQFVYFRPDELLWVIAEYKSRAAVRLLDPSYFFNLATDHQQCIDVRVKKTNAYLSLLFKLGTILNLLYFID